MTTLTLGTAGLMQPYAGLLPPSRAEAEKLLFKALADGVTMIDTAPAYGTESLVGDLCRRAAVHVATKVDPRWRGLRAIREQLNASRTALRRDRIDLVQLHNPSVADLNGLVADELRHAVTRGDVANIGASVYTPAEAVAAIKAGFDYVQVPFNLLDQRMAATDGGRWSVFDLAQQRHVEILVRSPWLRGVLTQIATPYQAAEQAAYRARQWLLAKPEDMPAIALRFCLRPAVASVIVGPRTVAEWDAAVAATRSGPLTFPRRVLAPFCRSLDPDVIDPRRWDGVL